jgi:regulator of protease activity HflC (stomatin/prohibitin superfamily)
MLDQGLHTIIPFADSVKKVNIVPTTLNINVPVNSAGSITKDNQTVGSDLTVFYRFEESKLVIIAKNYGFDVLKSKIEKDTIEAFKQVIGAYSIYDIAPKQEDIRSAVKKLIVSKIGKYPILMDDVKISNYDWSDEFDKQIALTMQMAQEAKQSEQSVKKVEFEAQKRVKEAEANFAAEKLNAEAKKVKGEGIAAYNAAITSNPKNMDLEIQLKRLEIDKILAEKWDGVRVSEQNFTPLPIKLSSN